MTTIFLKTHHISKGETIAQSLKDRFDYGQNPEKTKGGELLSAYGCDPKTADAEFLLSKAQYKAITGREQRRDADVLCYQIRQSFKPGEITPEEANRIGYETAMRWTKGRHAFGNLRCNIVASASPMLLVERLNPSIVFDDTVSLDQQYCLVGQNWHTLDGFGIPVGSTDTESALVLSAYIPQRKGETDGGVDIPLIYIFTYDVNHANDPTNYAFIHGQLLTFEEMAEYKVYEDEQYACYEVTDLFYTDLRQYVESMVSQRSDIYFDEQIWTRVQNIYNYYTDKEELSSRFFYKDIPD